MILLYLFTLMHAVLPPQSLLRTDIQFVAKEIIVYLNRNICAPIDILKLHTERKGDKRFCQYVTQNRYEKQKMKS